MEGHLHPAPPAGSADSANDEPPISPPQHSSTGSCSETYVIQIPRDQIYRVPPPENAEIAERHRSLPANSHKKFWCSRLVVIGGIALAIVLIIGIVLGVVCHIYRPKSPEFSVENVVITQPQSSSSPHMYDISLKAKNTNGKIGIYYESSEEAKLLFREETLAKGKFPQFDQKGGGSTTIKVELAGVPKATLPREVPVSLSLNIVRVPVTMRSVLLKTWVMEADIACDLKVSSLKMGSRILSEKCRTTLRS